jgi:hypothetical protein
VLALGERLRLAIRRELSAYRQPSVFEVGQSQLLSSIGSAMTIGSLGDHLLLAKS